MGIERARLHDCTELTERASCLFELVFHGNTAPSECTAAKNTDGLLPLIARHILTDLALPFVCTKFEAVSNAESSIYGIRKRNLGHHYFLFLTEIACLSLSSIPPRTHLMRVYYINGINWTQNLNLELVHFLSSSVQEEVLESVGTGGASEATVTNWLPECIREFRTCLNSLPLSDLPTEISDVFSRLAHDLRRHAVRAIEALQLKETWEADVNDIEGGTTKTPIAYEEIMLDALDQCQEHVSCHASIEKPLFDSAELQERFPDWCGDAMVAFISTLRRLADQIESTIPSRTGEDDTDTARPSWMGGDMSTIRQSAQSHIVSQARGLLLVLNNAEWAGSRANLRLLTAYRALKYASPEHLQTRLADSWIKASQDLGSRYIRLRTTWICAPIKPQLTEFVTTCPIISNTHVTSNEFIFDRLRSLDGEFRFIKDDADSVG
ncbi:unnamed protein product [Echinostoma caproni]|uniref:Exocyst complex component 2 n=1 Tax=Echinostoma caproni TaxID=27848 RepID=A0A183AER6_9TREM|nr:unnamed protein product [Echinostoma caproni]